MSILKEKKTITKVFRAKRLLAVFILFALIFILVLGRLFYLMISNSNFYKAKAVEQWTSQVTVNAKRGRILDRNGNELAVSVEAYRVDIDMNALRQYMKIKGMTMNELSNKLSGILNMTDDQVSNILHLKSPNGMPVKFATLARKIDKTQADKIDALKIDAFIISSDSKRFYKNNNFLASTIGYVNSDGSGVSGVELSYNKELAGIAGRKILETDNRGNPLPYEDSQYIPPVDGKDIVLTIDQTIQLEAEKAAEKALSDNKAKSVTITVMNPKNGEILAMVNKPDYDPNNPNGNKTETGEQIAATWKNNAVQNTFEPGSIFKVITAYTGMAEKVVDDSTKFSDPGYIMVHGVRINCWQLSGHGIETFSDIIKNSCNVGFVELGQKIGKENLLKYINLFGFGQKTGIDLPGESQGIVRSPQKINDVDIANISFGQGVSVTAVQYLAAFNAVANGGTWIRPHVMKEIVHTDANNKQVVDSEYNNLGEKKILDPNVASNLRGYLTRVVSDPTGVGYKANVPGLDIAGKTGTAQKSGPNGGYEPGKYMASFAGMAPANDPKITMLISIDEPNPSNYYAGSTAAPVAQVLFKNIFDYMAITENNK